GRPVSQGLRHAARKRACLADSPRGVRGSRACSPELSPDGSLMNAATAVRYCEDVTRTQARNFWYGIRLLPEPKRQALASIYAMARRIDDIGDGTAPVEQKRGELD